MRTGPGLTTATGALLLFGAVQATMICYGLWRGERFGARQFAGLVLAVGGLVGPLLPGLSATRWPRQPSSAASRW